MYKNIDNEIAEEENLDFCLNALLDSKDKPDFILEEAIKDLSKAYKIKENKLYKLFNKAITKN